MISEMITCDPCDNREYVLKTIRLDGNPPQLNGWRRIIVEHIPKATGAAQSLDVCPQCVLRLKLEKKSRLVF